MRCAFPETGFDALQFRQLSQSWGLTPDQAALRVAEWVSTGQKATITEQLQ